MLVLSRKIGERLVIGENITVVVSRVAGNRVTLGIEAPSEVRIVRGELQAEPVDGRTPAGVLSSGFQHAADTAIASVPRLAK